MIPTPTLLQRDAEGRLIYAALSCPQDDAPTAASPWLIGIDDSDHSLRATTEVLRLTREINQPAIHLINVQAWLAKEAAESALFRRGWENTARARALIEQAGRPWQLHVHLGEAAEKIIAQSEQLPGCCIVIGSRGLGAVGSLLFGSVAYKVLLLSPVPVLMVR